MVRMYDPNKNKEETNLLSLSVYEDSDKRRFFIVIVYWFVLKCL